MGPRIDISVERVRRNAREIAARVGVDVYAVVKSNAYGLAIKEVAAAIGDVVAGFCVFSLEEAQRADLWNLCHKPILALGPPSENATVSDYVTAHVRPSVTTAEQAERLSGASPAVCVETGMRRFTCPAEQAAAVIAAGGCREVYTHATRPEQVEQLRQITCGHKLHLHAAASSLLDDPTCWLNAVRPGLALYRHAVRIAAPLVEIHGSPRLPTPAGYTGFLSANHGIILIGYRHGLNPGPCVVNGVRRRVLEVGMQSAYVEIGPNDTIGDEVIILGEGVEPDDIAAAWNVGPQQVLVSLLR